jgi:hypothetical protein
MNMKRTFGLAGLLLGSVFAVGALAASATPADASDEVVKAQTMMRSDAGPAGGTPKVTPKAPGQTSPPRAPSLRSDAGPPGANPVR